jgi:hypothetical protein
MFSLPLALLLGLPGGTPPTTSGPLILCNDPVGPGPGTCSQINAPAAPGPAPLVGIAAGFHWSRQLRRRINANTRQSLR